MSKKLTFEFVKEQIEKEGYKLLSTEYVNANNKLEIQCDKGHIYKTKYNYFKQGRRCSSCNGNQKHTYEYVKNYIEKEGYKLLSKEYINAYTNLKIKCIRGHIYDVTYSNFQQGQRCPICAIENKKCGYEYVKNYIEKEGYKLLSKEYINAFNKIYVRCPKNHEYEVKFNNFQQGKRCPICFYEEGKSKAEKEVVSIIENITNYTVIENDRTQIINPKTGRNLELDIWIPSIKKAIEYNGEFWHSSEYAKYKDYQKQMQCKEKGIDLLIIKEKDWINNKEKCVSLIGALIK